MLSNIVRALGNLGADALSLIRAFHPMVVCFAGALAGTALVFDALYVLGGTGLGLAALYTVPLLAGLIGCLIAAADDLELSGPVLRWTVATTLAGGLTNICLVVMFGAMWRTGPEDWAVGGQAVLMSAVSLPVIALNLAVVRELAHSLGLVLRTKLPAPKTHRAPKSPAKPSREMTAREKEALAPTPAKKATPGKKASRRPQSVAVVEEEATVAVLGATRWRAISSREASDPATEPPKRSAIARDIYPVEPRPVSTGSETGHGGRRLAASRRTQNLAPPARNSPRPGRRPGRSRPDTDET
ncbi:hypothetical protein OG394_16500 [Kribbella sp. NBC_01245]|uniref:hypothetical protein n=1 Tax=Kribbella sp. NBC_01245 TaxID=2903578 RepID=UPI002E2DB0D7|nr:hypothetical protein [Kribbella sp. NBC_01245]